MACCLFKLNNKQTHVGLLCILVNRFNRTRRTHRLISVFVIRHLESTKHYDLLHINFSILSARIDGWTISLKLYLLDKTSTGNRVCPEILYHRSLLNPWQCDDTNQPITLKYMFSTVTIWAVTCHFQQCGVLTSVDSDKPLQPIFKLRHTKWCSVSSLIFKIYQSDQQRLWSGCPYAQANLRICWTHIPHCWKSHVVLHKMAN